MAKVIQQRQINFPWVFLRSPQIFDLTSKIQVINNLKRRAWRPFILFSILFFLPTSIAFAQSTAQIIVHGGYFNYNTTSASRNTLMGANTSWDTPSTDRQAIIPDAGTVRDLRINLEFAPGAGNSVSFTLRKDTGSGPVATGLTCTVSNTSTSCSDTSNSVTVAAGDKLDIEASPSGTPTAGQVHYTTKYVSNTAKHTILLGSSSTSPSTYWFSCRFGGSDLCWRAWPMDAAAIVENAAPRLYVLTTFP